MPVANPEQSRAQRQSGQEAIVDGPFYDALETRDPAAREAALMAALPRIVAAAKQHAPAYRDRLANISEKNVQKAANEKVSGQNVAAVLVGNASAFKQGLEGMGTVEVIPIDKLNLN